jgi:hypothetical protein
MLVSHPMMMKSPIVAVPVLFGGAQVCFTHTHVGTEYITFDPSTYIAGMEDDDYVIIVTTASGVHAARVQLYHPEWTVHAGARGDTSGNTSQMVMGKFWVAADPSDQILVYTASPGGVCFTIFVARGVSHRKPVDLRANCQQDTGVADSVQSFWFPPWRPHQDSASGAAAIHVGFFQLGGTTPLIPAVETNVSCHPDTWISNFFTQIKSPTQSACLGAIHYQGNLQNTAGSNGVLAHGTLGFSRSGLHWEEDVASGEFDRWCYHDYGGSRTHFISRDVSATAGDDIFLEMTGLVEGTVSNGDFVMILSITDPDGFEWGQEFRPTVWSDFAGNLDGLPDGVYGAPGEAGNGSVCSGRGGIWLTADSTGTYTARMYVGKEGTGLTFSAGPNPALTYSVLAATFGAGISLNAPPFIDGTFTAQAGDFSYDGYCAPVIFKVGMSATATMPTEALQSLIFEICQSTTVFKATRMLPEYSYSGITWADSDNLNPAGTLQNYGFRAASSFITDTSVPPTYRLTEGGAETDGKYYWELTAQESTSSTSFLAGVIHAGTTWSSWLNSLTIILTSDRSIGFNGAGDTRQITGDILGDFGSVVAGDVFGFALDTQGQTCALYRNGALLYTADTASAGEGDDEKRQSWQFAFAIKDSVTDTAPVLANFGPAASFVYTPPAGYVAWDYAVP